MNKIIFVVVSVVVTVQLSAMNASCWLNKLDLGIQNLIASYLIFDDVESEEEFIGRIKSSISKNKFSDDFYKFRYPMKNWYGSNDTLVACCPNYIRAAVVQSMCVSDVFQQKLIIINHKTKQKQSTKYIDSRNYIQLALSPCASMFATIHYEVANDIFGNAVIDRPQKYVLIIQDVGMSKTQKYSVSKDFIIPHDQQHLLAFNKQGTHIIMCYKDRNKIVSSLNKIDKNNAFDHLIVPVTIVTKDKCIEEKTLQRYFKQRLVCKKIPD